MVACRLSCGFGNTVGAEKKNESLSEAGGEGEWGEWEGKGEIPVVQLWSEIILVTSISSSRYAFVQF